jgi:hypothetical protein
MHGLFACLLANHPNQELDPAVTLLDSEVPENGDFLARSLYVF